MLKILAMLFVLAAAGSAQAEQIQINCSRGDYAGWNVWYEGKGSFQKDGPVKYHFENQSAASAFHILAIVNYYDYFGNYLGRDEKKYRGPIHKGQFIEFIGTVPQNAYKIDCELYWTDRYKGIDREEQ